MQKKSQIQIRKRKRLNCHIDLKENQNYQKSPLDLQVHFLVTNVYRYIKICGHILVFKLIFYVSKVLLVIELSL